MPAVSTTGIIAGDKPRTYLAGVANLKRGTLVMQGADDNHVIPATANASAFGVVNGDGLNVGDPISITRLGEGMCICGAPIIAGQRFISTAAGLATPTAAAGDNLVGYAISSAAVAGDYFVGFILPSVR